MAAPLRSTWLPKVTWPGSLSARRLRDLVQDPADRVLLGPLVPDPPLEAAVAVEGHLEDQARALARGRLENAHDLHEVRVAKLPPGGVVTSIRMRVTGA